MYNREWYNKILLKCKTPIEGFDENQFFDPKQIQCSIENQISFVKKSPKKFYLFKVIEIVNEKEVKEHATFIKPYYANSKQFVYFSQNMEYMIESFFNSRVYLFKKKDVRSTDAGVTCEWEQVLKFSQFPTDAIEKSLYPYIMSPDFTQHLDVDRKNKTFMIRDTLTHHVTYEIPKWIMSAEDEPFLDVLNRFIWIDNQTIKIVNHEGVERLFDLTKNFREIEFNIIPIYDRTLCKNGHVYFNRPELALDNVLDRLKNKY